MKVADVGRSVRSYRKASGVSQKTLAGMVGISRATLNYLESGRDIEIGAGKLLALLDVLGVPFAIPADVDRIGDDAVLDRAVADASADGDRGLPRQALVEALTTGRVPVGFEEQVATALGQVTAPTAFALVRCVSTSSGLAARAVWKNGRTLAGAVGAPRKVWLSPD